jgi:hypothetical protein
MNYSTEETPSHIQARVQSQDMNQGFKLGQRSKLELKLRFLYSYTNLN